MLFRLLILIAALASPPAAQAATEISASDLERLKETIRFQVARNGDEVVVAWSLPPLRFKGLDIYRNTRDRASGRTRIDFVHTEPAEFRDKVPDAGTTYWYWLKVVLASGESINVGPVKTPDPVVWTP